ncbi:hypothetical protein [Paenarthrobacter sp. NCHU4564]|uniref:hypothetical protein n=1 Tax=Paenarthrobacter sp. NCHU4564 TaxID=3451353 RepID=UPI003F952078
MKIGDHVEVKVRRQDTRGEVSLLPHHYLVIGHGLGEDVPFDRIDFDIEGLSRRAVEMYNSGHSLSVASYQEPWGTVSVTQEGVGLAKLQKNRSQTFIPPFSIQLRINVGDDVELAFRVSCGPAREDEQDTAMPPEPKRRNSSDWLLAVNALACALEDGLPLTNGAAKSYFNAAIDVSSGDTYRWPRARADLAARYGINPADLEGLLLAGRNRRDVTPDVQDMLRAHRNNRVSNASREEHAKEGTG